MLNNTVHISKSFTPFYVNSLTHPRVPLTLPISGSGLGGGESADNIADISPTTIQDKVSKFLATGFCVLRHVRDVMADRQFKQNDQADAEDLFILMKVETKSY